MKVINELYKHSEAQNGEVYMRNETQAGFHKRVEWKSKRQGCVPYSANPDVHGKAGTLVPVFVQESELVAAGYTVNRAA